jgi:hypothetical protein
MSIDKPLERFTLVLAIGIGALTLAFISAAANLWSYPYPRALFLMAALRAGAATMLLLVCSVMLAELVDGRARPVLALATLIFAGLICVSSFGAIFRLSDCARPSNELCNLTADKATPEQLRQMEANRPPF